MQQPAHPSEPYPWRLFWLLLIAAIASVLAIMPIAFEMTKAIPLPQELPISLPLLIAVGIVQNLAILALIVGVGVKLSRRLGLRAPLLESWVSGSKIDIESSAKTSQILTSGLLIGTAVGLIALISLLQLLPRLPNLPFVMIAGLPIWKRFLACFYGGIYEELLTRLFLLSLLAWIANRSWRKPAPKLTNGAFWFANFLAAVLFGLGHLPSASLLMPITPLVVTAALLLNGIAGISFGYLYRRQGLETAMIAHFTADFVLYVLGPALVRT